MASDAITGGEGEGLGAAGQLRPTNAQRACNEVSDRTGTIGAMPLPRSNRDLLRDVLEGYHLTVDDLQDLSKRPWKEANPENLYLDYKGGELMKNTKEAARKLREYVAAFANSDGGLLVLGIDDKTREVTPTQRPGDQSLQDWAANTLTPLAGYLSPPPVIYEVPHPKGPVLIVGVARAPRLVPLAADGRLTYHLRIGHQTVQAPDYLISDLVVGHRQVLDLAIRVEVEPQAEEYSMKLRLHLENIGLTWPGEMEVGVIGYSMTHPRQPSSELLQYIDIQGHGDLSPMVVGHSRAPVLNGGRDCSAAPFGLAPVLQTNPPFTLPPDFQVPRAWNAALFVATRSSPPAWFQLAGRLSFGPGHQPEGTVTATRIWSGRPAVNCQPAPAVR